jgi:hypothetical protein
VLRAAGEAYEELWGPLINEHNQRGMVVPEDKQYLLRVLAGWLPDAVQYVTTNTLPEPPKAGGKSSSSSNDKLKVRLAGCSWGYDFHC